MVREGSETQRVYVLYMLLLLLARIPLVHEHAMPDLSDQLRYRQLQVNKTVTSAPGGPHEPAHARARARIRKGALTQVCTESV